MPLEHIESLEIADGNANDIMVRLEIMERLEEVLAHVGGALALLVILSVIAAAVVAPVVMGMSN
jgi:hypothetical protein